jgi:serine phosphatase RsbU (regulator of sigma subunit)
VGPSVPRGIADTDVVGAETLGDYVATLVHAWCRILAVLAGALLLLFIPIDYLLVPRERFTEILTIRLCVVAVVFATYVAMRIVPPGRKSHAFSHFLAILVSTMVAIFTTYTGGFESPYYAAFNLIIVAINLVLPWGVRNTLINITLIVSIYVVTNLVRPQPTPPALAVVLTNATFIASTAVFAIVGSYLKQRLTTDEFVLRRALQRTRDTLWAELGLAKRIQTALLPSMGAFGDHELAALMMPADEVGGDYYDHIETEHGEHWVAIGDVSGHGVEAGLIMMMAQTSLLTALTSTPGLAPSAALDRVNATLFENMKRLGAKSYMTMTALRIERDRVVYAGRHQDLLVWRARTGEVEVVPTSGTWLGLVPSLDGAITDAEVALEPGDVMLLFTDGITEAIDAAGVMFGEDRVAALLRSHARGDLGELVKALVEAALRHSRRQEDDVTIVALRRRDSRGG